MRSRPYVDALVFIGGASADVRARVANHLELPNQVAWASGGGFVPGGRAAMAAAAARSLGRQFVELVSSVGDDVAGEAIREAYESAGVTTRLVETAPGNPTAMRLVVVDDAGNKRVVVVCSPGGFEDEAHLTNIESTVYGSEMVFVTLEGPAEPTLRAVEAASAHDVPVVVNAFPLPGRDGSAEADPRILSRADVLLVNWQSGVLMSQLIDLNAPNAAELCERLLDLGPRNLVITLGEHGSIVANADRHGLVEPYPLPVVDSSWAGDVYAGALAVGLTNQAKGNWRWEELVEAARFASAASGLCVTRSPGLANLPTNDEVELFMRDATHNARSGSDSLT